MFKSLSSIVFSVLLITACSTTPPGIGKPIHWSELQNWEADNHADAWEGFIKGCEKMRQPEWQAVCQLANNSGPLNDEAARAFFETHFELRPVYAEGGETTGLITGYYEPLLMGSLQKSEEYHYPLYGVPDDLLVVDLSDLYPELGNMRLRGKLEGNRVVPYYDRSQLDKNPKLLLGNEILWVNSVVDAFFLHVQGSGRVLLNDGSTLAVGYAEQNGHPYQSIGRVLIEMGELEREEVTLFTIED
ncbi:MAG: MltA domain-containing protein, partial [Pseudomonadota bacterium]